MSSVATLPQQQAQQQPAQQPTTTSNLPAVPVSPQRLVVEDNGPLAFLLDTARFEHLQRISNTMAMAAFLPRHLRGQSEKESAANCFRVVNQSLRWGFDPFSVVDETYVVSGKLGYQGKLVAAVINARAGLAQPLGYVFNGGTGDGLAVVVYGSVKPLPEDALELLAQYAEDENADAALALQQRAILFVRVSVAQAKTQNDMWKKDPHQKLCYTGATKWARRHRPEIMLGVLTDDDLDAIGAQPEPETTTGRRLANRIGHSMRGETKIGAGPKPSTNGTATNQEPPKEAPNEEVKQETDVHPAEQPTWVEDWANRFLAPVERDFLEAEWNGNHKAEEPYKGGLAKALKRATAFDKKWVSNLVEEWFCAWLPLVPNVITLQKGAQRVTSIATHLLPENLQRIHERFNARQKELTAGAK